jgi:hypothetical protein
MEVLNLKAGCNIYCALIGKVNLKLKLYICLINHTMRRDGKVEVYYTHS